MDRSSVKPPPLPLLSTDLLIGQMASRDQRIRAGIIDHTIDSTLWFWLAGISSWCLFNLQSALDARSFFIVLVTQFKGSALLIGILLLFDFLWGAWYGQTIGQRFNHIYKKSSPKAIETPILDVIQFWLHGLVSRCFGMPLLLVCLIAILIINPMIHPMRLSAFSLLEPAGSLLLLIFLLKIIVGTLVLFAVFLPFGLGFIRAPLPTWYDQFLGVIVLQDARRRKG